MLVVTGAIGSGTTLVAEYLDKLGIDMMHGQCPRGKNGRIWEDMRYTDAVYDILQSSREHNISKLRALFREEKSEPWGFKCPAAILLFDMLILMASVENCTPLSIIHIYRDLDATCESLTRKPKYPEGVQGRINLTLNHHVEAVKAYDRWSGTHNIKIVHIDDVLKNNGRDFYDMVNPPESYFPISDILMTDRIRLAGPSSNIHSCISATQHKKIYYYLNMIQWKPELDKDTMKY